MFVVCDMEFFYKDFKIDGAKPPLQPTPIFVSFFFCFRIWMGANIRAHMCYSYLEVSYSHIKDTHTDKDTDNRDGINCFN